MTEREENILNMFIATAQFDTENSDDYKDLPLAASNFVIVRSVIAALETDSATQVSGASGRAVEQKVVLRREIRQTLKRYSRSARTLNIDDPGLSRLFRIPDSDNDLLLLATAREFVEEARRFAADFAALGIPATLADELEADIDAFEAAMNAKASGQMETVGATAGIDERIEEGMKAEKILDSIMHNVYFDNPVKLSQWKTARHVKKSPNRQGDPTPPTS
ncbi:MAG TPA: hypothetical protein PKY59_05930 [Pyrinomonadaceae bacterium]|nr:hypothetical protein [Pyrinomonadaceae bacterium]